MKLNRRDCRVIVAALLRAADWSDVSDNAKANGAAWTRKERRFVERCMELRRRTIAHLAAAPSGTRPLHGGNAK